MFVTSVDRPISESEAVFLGKIAQWDKKIAVILNKKDHLSDGTNELSRVLEFLKSNVCKILESEPPIFPISAKEGMKAKLLIAKDDTIEEGKVLLKKSGLKDLEDYIERILSNEEKIILKLKTPLGVASHILNKHKIECEELRQGVLSEDVETLKNIEERMRAFNEELERDFKYQLSQIDNVLLRMLDRCDEFLTDQMRIGNLVGIIKNSKLSDQFEKFVVKDFTSEIEELISGTSAWLMDKNSILAQHVTSYILRRSEKHANMIVRNL
jgi:tRNA threonylcarbamoyladenosine modification (KEOPS) complex Cgi121 subunit